MRNAVGLMLGSVVAAAIIAGMWFVGTSIWAHQAAPQTVAARTPDPLPPPRPSRLAERDDVDVTASIDKPAAPAPMVPKTICNNPDALGVSRVVEVDTTGGPGFGFENFKQLDFLTDKEVVL